MFGRRSYRDPAHDYRPFGKRTAPPNPVLTLVVLLTVGILLGVLHNRWRMRGKMDPVLGVVQLAESPFARTGATLRAGFTDNLSFLWKARSLQTENARLLAENARLKQENESLHLKAAEADRLRATLSLARPMKPEPLAASVIGLLPSPHFDTILLSRGARDGVKEKMVVRTPEGLVGQIIDVGPTTCEAMLLTDLNSGVGGLVKRGSKTQGVGIVEGAGRGLSLKMVNLKREADIKPGDVVVSSGLGGVFPPDVPIGVITHVSTEDAHFLKAAEIEPASPLPGDLREALILR